MIRALAIAMLLASAAAGIQTIRLSRAQTTIANMARQSVAEQFATSEAYRAEERMRARYIAGIGAAYEEGKANAQAAADRAVADLRAGNLQLRDRWQGCEARRVSGPAAPAGEPDAAADDRIESAGRIVRAAAECDAQVRGLQALIQADREPVR